MARRVVAVLLVATVGGSHAAWALEPAPAPAPTEPSAGRPVEAGEGSGTPAPDGEPQPEGTPEPDSAPEADGEPEYQAPTLFPIPLREPVETPPAPETPNRRAPLPDRESVRANLTANEREWIMARTLHVSVADEDVRVTRGRGTESLDAFAFSRAVGESHRLPAMRHRRASANTRFALVTGCGALATVLGYFLLGSGIRAAYGDRLFSDEDDDRSTGGGAITFGTIFMLGGAAVTVVTPFVWLGHRRRTDEISYWYASDTVRSLVNEENQRLLDEIARRRRGDYSSLDDDSDSEAAQSGTSAPLFVPLRPPTRPPLEFRIGLAGAGVGATLTF